MTIKTKKEPSPEDKANAIRSKIYKELQAMDPENREEAVTLRLMNNMDRSQTPDKDETYQVIQDGESLLEG